MKKRILAALLLSVILLAGCSGKGQADLQSRGLELLQKLDRMAQSSEYVGFCSGSEEIAREIEQIGAADYSQPQAVYEVILPEKILGMPVQGLSEELQEDLLNRMFASLPSQLNAAQGVNVLAASSVLTVSDHFIDKTLKERALYFYLYGGEWSGAVYFLPGEENILSAGANFVKNEELAAVSSEEELADWLQQSLGLQNGRIRRAD